MEQSKTDVTNMATLFISFDLVNCTQYKASHKGTWTTGVSGVLGHIIQTFAQKGADGYRFWKVLGDEVVFTKSIPYAFEVQDILSELYYEMVSLNQKLSCGALGVDVKGLSVKTTVWLAGFLVSQAETDNIYMEYKIDDDHLQSEYLGTDMDAGFRISQYTSSNRMVISFELAALFLKDRLLKRNLDKLHFVGYRSLKGVWDGKGYPIFMYHGEGDFDGSIVDTSDPKADILREYVALSPRRTVVPPYGSYEEQVLSQLCQDEGLNQKVEQLLAVVNTQDVYAVASTSRLKTHYSVLCYSQDGDEISFMITRDKEGKLGFGGAEMHHNLQYLDTMNLYYQEEFRVDLDFVKDSRYHDPIPLILETYHVNGLRGSVFLAKISGEKLWGELSEAYSAKMMKLEEVPEFSYYDCSSSGKAILEKALTYIMDT